MSDVIAVRQAGPVARITISRPGRANAMNADVLESLDQVLASVASDPTTKVAVIEGAGKGFSAGYDIEPGGSVEESKNDIVADWLRLRANAERWSRLWRFPKPVIAKVHGYCIAGGLELVTACDLVIATEDSRFGYPAVRAVGTPPFMMLPLLVGGRIAREMLFTGDSITGSEAVAAGLANRAVPAEELESEVHRIAERIALMPLEQLMLAKASIIRGQDILGYGPAMLSGVEFDAISHFGNAVQSFWQRSRAEGVKAAIRHRDEPFAEHWS